MSRWLFFSVVLLSMAASCGAGPITRRSFRTSDGVNLSYLEAGREYAGKKKLAIALVPGWSMPAVIWRQQVRTRIPISPHHEVIHDLTLARREYVLQPIILRRVRHSRMLLAGIQAKFGLDPRLKHSGVTVLGVASLHPSRNFRREHEGHEGFGN